MNRLNITQTANRNTESTSLDEVSVYYPYSVVFQEPYDDNGGGGGDNQQPMTIVTATADADQGLGYQPYTDSNGATQYTTVLVDDEYAMANPTQIIGVNGVEPYGGETTANLIFPPTPPIQTPGLPRPVKQVYISHLQCKRHYDKLVSFTGNGGGNEMVFTRADGFLKAADGHFTADAFTNQRDLSRWHITHKKFHDFNLSWDEDWESANREQNIGLYEKDNRNEQKFTGSLKTTLSTGVEGNIGFEIKFKSDDNLIFQSNYKHDVFFVMNRVDLEGMMHEGWPVRRKDADDSFTLADRTLIP